LSEKSKLLEMLFPDWPVANSWYNLKWEHAADVLTAGRKAVLNPPSGQFVRPADQQKF